MKEKVDLIHIRRNGIKNPQVNIERLKEINISEILFKRGEKINKCPKCASGKIVKCGFYREYQRYKCQQCSRKFSDKTGTIFSYSKKNLELWVEFFRLLEERNSLRSCSKKLGINIATAFMWRHKILYALTLHYSENKLSDEGMLINFSHKETFKGSKASDKETKYFHNIMGCDKNGTAISNILTEQILDKREVNSYIRDKVSKKCRLYGGQHWILSACINVHNRENKIKEKTVSYAEERDKIRIYIEYQRKILRKFHGIATKYLNNYLSFMNYIFSTREINANTSFENLFHCYSFKTWYEIKEFKASPILIRHAR